MHMVVPMQGDSQSNQPSQSSKPEGSAQAKDQQVTAHQTPQPEAAQPEVSSAYRDPKRAWKKVQQTGQLAPAPGATELKVEHKFSDEVSVDALK